MRPSGAGAPLRKRRGEEAWRGTRGGKGGSLKPEVVPCPIPRRRAYHGTGNRLAPTVHFSEGGKTAYCTRLCNLPVAVMFWRRRGRRASVQSGASCRFDGLRRVETKGWLSFNGAPCADRLNRLRGRKAPSLSERSTRRRAWSYRHHSPDARAACAALCAC